MSRNIAQITAHADPQTELCGAVRKLADELSPVRRVGIDVDETATIVALGPRSVGRSSLLRDLCGFAFPETDSEFPSFLVILELWRAETSVVKTMAVCNDGKKTIAVDEEASFAKVYEEATHYLRGKAGAHLCVMLKGPGLPNLRVFDLPTTAHGSSGRAAAPQNAFEAKLAGLLRSSDNIILAVVDACQPSTWEETMTLLRPFEGVADRTLGVVMKADRLHSSQLSFSATMQFVQNERPDFFMPRGWCVLARAGATRESMDDAEKKLFASADWQFVPVSQKGMAALRCKLRDFLFETMRRRMPALATAIKEKLDRQRRDLCAFGASFPEDDKSRRCLMQSMVSKYQTIARDGQVGFYGQPFFAPTQLQGLQGQKRALKSRVNEINAAFYTVMKHHGAFWLVEGPSGQCMDPRAPAASNFARSFDTSPPLAITVEQLHHLFPGTSYDDLASRVFHQQSDKWPRIASKYLELIHAAANAFVTEAVGFTFGSYHSLKKRVEKEFALPLLQDYKTEIEEECKELIKPYRDASLTRTDQSEYHHTNYYIAGQTKALLDAQPGNPSFSSNDVYRIILRAKPPAWPGFHFFAAVDAMTEHYDRSLDMFMENVIALGRDKCLARLPTLLDRLSSPELDLPTIRRLAREPEATMQARERVQEAIRVLDEAWRVCASNSI